MRVVAEPYTGVADVTPDDATIIAQTRGLMAAVTGNIAVVFPNGSETTLVSVVAGHIYPISVVTVKATGTDATGIVAFY